MFFEKVGELKERGASGGNSPFLPAVPLREHPSNHVLRDFFRMHQTDIHKILKEITKDGIDLRPLQIADLEWISLEARFFLQANCEP